MGIDGSALGNIAIHTALNYPFYNILGEEERGASRRIFVFGNTPRLDSQVFSISLNWQQGI